MIILNSGSGSHEITLLHPVDDYDEWASLRANVTRVLRARGDNTAAELLESLRLDIVAATNSFNDDFEILIADLSPEEYATYERRAAQRWERASFNQIAEAVSQIGKRYIRFIVVDVKFEQHQAVPSPDPKITSATVQSALTDAEHLILSRGPENAVDRVHTAFHGYLLAACREAGIAVVEDDTLQVLFKKLRTEHRRLAPIGADPHMSRIFGGMASILDSLNTIRNQHTLAHPNDQLLGRVEATFLINCTRSMLAFIDAKLAG